MNSCISLDSGPAKAALPLYTDQLAPRLMRMAAFYARRSHLDRDDLLQEAWQGLIEGWQKMNPRIGSPHHFLIRCAKWRMLSYCRKARRRSLSSLEVDIPLIDPALASADLRLDMEILETPLGPLQRQIIACLLSGMTWRETGERIGCSSANIAYHMRQIRMALSTTAA